MAENVCRLCMARDNLVWIFDHRIESPESMKDVIKITTGVEIDAEDRISQRVCSKCCQITIKMFQFRASAIKCDFELKKKYALLQSELKKEEPFKHETVLKILDKYPYLQIPAEALELDLLPSTELDVRAISRYFKEKALKRMREFGNRKSPPVDLEEPPAKVRVTSPEVVPLVTVNEQTVHNCEVCNLVVASQGCLTNHMRRHMKCPFCGLSCRSLAKKKSHVEVCPIKMMIKHQPTVHLEPLELDGSLFELYPEALKQFSAPAVWRRKRKQVPIIVDDEEEENHLEMEEQEQKEKKPIAPPVTRPVAVIRGNSHSPETENLPPPSPSSDLIHCISDDEGEALQQASSTPSEIPPAIDSSSSIVKPTVNILQSTVLNNLDPKLSELLVVKELMLRVCKHLLATDFVQQTDLPQNDQISVTRLHNIIEFKGLKRLFSSYKIPVTITKGDLFAQFDYKHRPTVEQPRKNVKPWHNLPVINLKKPKKMSGDALCTSTPLPATPSTSTTTPDNQLIFKTPLLVFNANPTPNSSTTKAGPAEAGSAPPIIINSLILPKSGKSILNTNNNQSKAPPIFKISQVRSVQPGTSSSAPTTNTPLVTSSVNQTKTTGTTPRFSIIPATKPVVLTPSATMIKPTPVMATPSKQTMPPKTKQTQLVVTTSNQTKSIVLTPIATTTNIKVFSSVPGKPTKLITLPNNFMYDGKLVTHLKPPNAPLLHAALSTLNEVPSTSKTTPPKETKGPIRVKSMSELK